MARTTSLGGRRCSGCRRALLLPLLRDVSVGQDPADAPTLVRCAYCGRRSIVRGSSDSFAAQRAAAISFVTRGHGAPRRDAPGH